MSEPQDRPPQPIRRVLHRLFAGQRGEEALEDLDRQYGALRQRYPRMVAAAWYLLQLFRLDTWRLARALWRVAEEDAVREEVGRGRGHNGLILTPLARIPKSAVWFYTAEWRKRILEAEEDLTAGRYRYHDSVEDLLDDLSEEIRRE